MKPTIAVLFFAFILSASVVANIAFTSLASVESDGSFPELSMPTEQVNYTVMNIDGILWAKIDGEYPIRLSQPAEILPMAYPMPPGTAEIHVYLNNQELGWTNITGASREMIHKTAIGNWWIISSNLRNLPENFILKIHYEHPIEKINSSYVFLYDLNIAQYLSESNPNSTAIFTIRFETNITDLQVFTAPPESSASQWQSKGFTEVKEGSNTVVAVEMNSQYDAMLPGDLAVVFNSVDGNQSGSGLNEAPIWVVAVVVDLILFSVLICLKRKRLVSLFSSRETAGSAGI
jgi:hypothetical protein